MAFIIEVGVSSSLPKWQKSRISKDIVSMSRTLNSVGCRNTWRSSHQHKPPFSRTIGGLSGLEPVRLSAALLALNRLNADKSMFQDTVADYDDLVEEDPNTPYQHLLFAGGAGCFFVPIELQHVMFPTGKSFTIGSSMRLKHETLALKETLKKFDARPKWPDSPEGLDELAECDYLVKASEISIQQQLPIVLYWLFEPWDGRKPILDSTAEAQGFTDFSRSCVLDSGRKVLVCYRSEASYVISCEYLMKWFETEQVREDRPGARLQIRKSRVISRGQQIRVWFHDGSIRDINWDSVLMACEPKYEHYGGFTVNSRQVTETWQMREGPFRK